MTLGCSRFDVSIESSAVISTGRVTSDRSMPFHSAHDFFICRPERGNTNRAVSRSTQSQIKVRMFQRDYVSKRSYHLSHSLSLSPEQLHLLLTRGKRRLIYLSNAPTHLERPLSVLSGLDATRLKNFKFGKQPTSNLAALISAQFFKRSSSFENWIFKESLFLNQVKSTTN